MQKIKIAVKEELKKIIGINKSQTSWKLPFASMISVGVPLLIGAYYNHLNYALISSMGSLVFMYFPKKNLMRNLSFLFCISFAFLLCFFMGFVANQISHFIPLIIMITCILVSSSCSYFKLQPPGSFLFIMIFSISAFMPTSLIKLPNILGFIFLGTLMACFVAFIYSILNPVKKEYEIFQPEVSFDKIILNPFIIGFFVGLSIFVAQNIGLQRPYWAGITTFSIMQALSYHIVLSRHIQNLVGTILGICLSIFILPLSENMWVLSFVIMGIIFISQFLISRNYTLAIIFLTPMSIFLAEIGSFHIGEADIIISRFLDTFLGGIIALTGSLVFNHQKTYLKIGKILKFLVAKKS